MPRAGKTVRVARSEGRLYIDKSQQFLLEAHAAADAGRPDAAMLNAIHAAISAGDAVSAALSGRRSADPDHQRAVDLLEEVAGPSPEIRSKARQMRTLLAKKNLVEYESRKASVKEARDSVERAGELVEWAAETVRRAKL